MSYVEFILESYIRCFGVGPDQNGQLHGVGYPPHSLRGYPGSGMGTGIGPGVGPVELPRPRKESFTGVGHARGLIKHGLGLGISEGGGPSGIFTEEGNVVNTVWCLT